MKEKELVITLEKKIVLLMTVVFSAKDFVDETLYVETIF